MWLGKRLFDLFFSSCGLLLLSPFFVLIAAAIFISDFGPVFYLQTRIGQNSKPFKILKFRTMIVDADKKGLLITAGNDRRITAIGKILRATKLDELPQLINVLFGQMSFVGPRPEVEKYVAMLSEQDRNKILSLKPGITDLASIEFRNESDLLAASKDPEQTYIRYILPQKTKLSLKYYELASLSADLKIIFKTLQRIF